MRKYFLISALLLLTSENINAALRPYSSNFTASASIEYPTTLNCSELKFGTIMLKNNTEEATVTLNNGSETHSDNVYSVSNYAESVCDINMSISRIDSFSPDSITLTSLSSDVELPVVLNHDELKDKHTIGGTLTIPAGTPQGNYTATVTLSIVISDVSNDPT